MLNKEEIKKALLEYSDFRFSNYTGLSELERDSRCINNYIKDYKNKIEELLLKIEILEEENQKINNRINDLSSRKTKNIITINENIKMHKWDHYSLYLKVKTVDEKTNELIQNLQEKSLEFKERGKYKDSILTNWIKEYGISEIYTNTNMKLNNLEKVILENNIEVIQL